MLLFLYPFLGGGENSWQAVYRELPYTSDLPLFSGQARPRPHVLPAFTLRPENGPIIRLTVPAVNAGRQKTSAGTVSPPFRPAPDLTEAPLSDFTVSLRSLENAAYPSYPLDMFSLEMFENIAFIMAKHADPSIPDTPEEWLDNFNTFSIYQVLPQLIELWGLNVKTDVESKKKFAQLSVK